MKTIFLAAVLSSAVLAVTGQLGFAGDATTGTIENASGQIKDAMRSYSMTEALVKLKKGKPPMRKNAILILSSMGDVSNHVIRDAFLDALKRDKDRRVQEKAAEALLPLFRTDVEVRRNIIKYLNRADFYDMRVMGSALYKMDLCGDPDVAGVFEQLRPRGDACGGTSSL